MMNSISTTLRNVLVLALGLVITAGIGTSDAQFESTWLDVGDYHGQYYANGAATEGMMSTNSFRWKPIIAGDVSGSDQLRARALYLGAKDWEQPDGTQHDYFVVTLGPRNPGVGQVFPTKTELVSSLGNNENPKTSQPTVLVEGGQSYDNVNIVDRVDPEMDADRMLLHAANTKLGVSFERRVYAFSQEHHDDYHIIEYIYTNTGNTDDDPKIELPDQTVEDLLIYKYARHTGNEQAAWVTGAGAPWGQFTMTDVVGDGHEHYDVDFRATYSWLGWRPQQTKFNNLGGPIWDDNSGRVSEGDTVGRLAGGTFGGQLTVFAEKSGGAGDYTPSDFPPSEEADADQLSSRDPAKRQPYKYGYQNSDTHLMAPDQPMQEYYEEAMLMDGPNQGSYPHYADLIEPDGNFATTTRSADNGGNEGGFGATTTYGPYTLEPGESVRIVITDAVHGLSYDARVQIGKAYKRSGADDSLHIAYDANGDGTIQGTGNDVPGEGVSRDIPYDESLTKNQWVISAKDSLFQTFRRATAAYEAEMDIIDGPLPPKEFRVMGRANRVDLSWTTYPDADPQGWEIYRTHTRTTLLPYTKVASLEGSARSYQDTELQRGLEYYYYIQSVGEDQPVDSLGINGTPDGQPMRSNRYYTQTYDPVSLKREPGEQITDFEVVPNPFNLGAEPDVRWPGREDKLGFLDIPGRCRIEIYTEVGEHVKTIEHTDGSGDEFWNMTTDSRQMIASGMYVAVVTDLESGEQTIRKFSIIR